MRNVRRKLAFVLAASNHGAMIVSRFDQQKALEGRTGGIGVGYQIFQRAAFDPDEVEMALQLLGVRRQHHGDGVVAVDCGANIGPHTIEWATAMTGWGEVLAIEAQERLFYALAGNIALNNCFNARALHAAVGAHSGTMPAPVLDYMTESSFGSLELKPVAPMEYIGQVVDYSAEGAAPIRALTLDELALPRVDFIKIDIEGMEMEALAGAERTVRACRPILLVETIKVDKAGLVAWFEARGYQVMAAGINLLGVHREDPCLASLRFQPAPAA